MPEPKRESVAAELRRTLEALEQAEARDRQMEQDVQAGKLDKLAEQVRADIQAGRTRPL